MVRRAWGELTEAERATYRQWWIRRSGLSRQELVDIAIGLGQDTDVRGLGPHGSRGPRSRGTALRGLLVADEYEVGEPEA